MNKQANSQWVKKALYAFYPEFVWHESSKAPDSWKALQVAFLSGSVPISNAASDATIYASPSDNVVFRAWHDATHIKLGRGFDRDSELAVAFEQIDQLWQIGAPSEVIKTIWLDIVGQVEYYSKYTEFVHDQYAFVSDCLLYNLDAVIECGIRY